jgi:type I restriction enzyme S subunit
MIGVSPPQGWKEHRLGEIAEIERESVLPEAISSGTSYLGLEHLGGDGSILAVQTVENGDLASNKFRFTSSHILYGKLRPYLSKIVRPEFDGVCSTDILPVRMKPGVSKDYLFHYLRHPRMVEFASARSEGANLPRLSPTQLERFPIFLPPTLKEQQRIAAILDKADAIRRMRHEASTLVRTFLLSTYLDLFGDPRVNVKRWQQKPLGLIASIERGKFTPRPRNDPRFYDGDHPFIQTGDISSSGGILSEWKQTLNEEGTRVSRSFPAGTVVIAIVGATIGETAILAREMYCPDSVIGIRPHEGVATSEYVEYSLRFFKQAFRDNAPETARANINLETLRPLQLPIPEYERQQNFTLIFTKCYDLMSKMRGPRGESSSLFDSLVQRAFLGDISL